MSTKELRPEVTSGVTSVIFGLVVLALFGWCYHWYDTNQKKAQRLEEARRQQAAQKESERNDADNALAQDVQRHHKPTWAGILDPHDMSPWVSVPAGYAWTFVADVDLKVHYRNRRDGSYGAETFPHDQPAKLIHVDTDKLKLENLADGPQRVKLWVYEYGDNTLRVAMPGGEILTSGAPTKPLVLESEASDNGHATAAHTEASFVARSHDDATLRQGTSPLEEAPSAPRPKVVAKGPPGPRADITPECGDRQIALPEPRESSEYSSGLYGVTIEAPRGCWSEWLVVPKGYVPYAMDVMCSGDLNYEIYPAHDGNWTIAGGRASGRRAFKPEERAGFESIRFRGYVSPDDEKKIVKLLFTKP